ncbi:MAG: methyltransferase domain-containing protein [Pirellulales bacterium]|nr:methyltransferase domain-containing protein [Pirellulales bacterium]
MAHEKPKLFFNGDLSSKNRSLFRIMNYDVPSPRLLEVQAAWLAPARARLLRRADVAKRRRVLDLACAGGAVAEELVRRSGGEVVALDRNQNVLVGGSRRFHGATLVRGEAEKLPLADAAFDLVFCQFALMWMDAAAVAKEVHRVLTRGGVFVAIEPDYGGMIEHPPEIAVGELWLAALERAGADPCVGRKLPGTLGTAGFEVRVDLLDRLESPDPLRFDLLGELPLADSERIVLDRARKADASLPKGRRVAHLPMFLITAEPTRP